MFFLSLKCYLLIFLKFNNYFFSGLYRRHVCPNNCGHSYTRKDNLTRHMKTKCGVLKKFFCEICKRSYARSDALKNHLKFVHKYEIESVNTLNVNYTKIDLF